MKHTVKILASTALLLTTQSVLANSPWVTDQGKYNFSVTYIESAFDEKSLGLEPKSAIAKITQKTTLLDLSYGFTETIMLDIQGGYTKSKFKKATRGEFNGATDTEIGITYQALNEFDGEALSITTRFSQIIKGGYERSSAGNPYAPGDRANGRQLSVQAGKFFSDSLVGFSQFGYRWRDDGVPDDIFYHLGININFNDFFSVTTQYSVTEGKSVTDININPPFSPS